MDAKGITLDEVMADLAEYFQPFEPPPPDAFTIDDLQDKFGLSRATARYRLDRLIEKGKMEKLDSKTYGAKPAYYRMVKNDSN